MKEESNRVYVKSLPEFIEVLLKKKELFGPEGDLWFRGHGSDSFKLLPSLFRNALQIESSKENSKINSSLIYQIEQNIDVSFNRKSRMYFDRRRINDTPWNRYFLKQHYKVPTRLLDWTENSLIALFFALSDQTVKDHTGEILMLNPYNLNNYTLKNLLKEPKYKFYNILSCEELPKKEELFNEEGQIRLNQLLRMYYRLDYKEEEKLYPLAIYPPHLDERMAAQQACFTIFGNMVKGLDIKDSENLILDRIYISPEYKDKILKELKLVGISYYSIFPDLDGLGHEINVNTHDFFKNSREWHELIHLLE